MSHGKFGQALKVLFKRKKFKDQTTKNSKPIKMGVAITPEQLEIGFSINMTN